jgi:hypothetical protein
MRFKPNQEIVCTNPDEWICTDENSQFAGQRFRGPKKDEIVTVDSYAPNLENCIFLKEYNVPIGTGFTAYEERWFEPVVPQSVIKAMMDEIKDKASEPYVCMYRQFQCAFSSGKF